MIKLTFYDTVTPLLAELSVRSPMLAREALQAAGAKLASRARKEMKTETTDWWQEVRNGKRRIFKSMTHNIGDRMSHTTGETLNPKNMASFINFYMSPKNPYVVVVGGAHPDFTPLKIRDGKVVGAYGKVKGVGKTGAAIIHKLDTGELNEYHPYSKKSWIPGARYPNRGFMQRAFSMSRTQIENTVISRFEKATHNIINNVEVKAIRRAYA